MPVMATLEAIVPGVPLSNVTKLPVDVMPVSSSASTRSEPMASGAKVNANTAQTIVPR
jgi:hypothetical protein